MDIPSAEGQSGTFTVQLLRWHHSLHSLCLVVRCDQICFIDDRRHRIAGDLVQYRHVFTSCSTPKSVREGLGWAIGLLDLPHGILCCLALAFGAHGFLSFMTSLMSILPFVSRVSMHSSCPVLSNWNTCQRKTTYHSGSKGHGSLIALRFRAQLWDDNIRGSCVDLRCKNL